MPCSSDSTQLCLSCLGSRGRPKTGSTASNQRASERVDMPRGRAKMAAAGCGANPAEVSETSAADTDSDKQGAARDRRWKADVERSGTPFAMTDIYTTPYTHVYRTKQLTTYTSRPVRAYIHKNCINTQTDIWQRLLICAEQNQPQNRLQIFG